MGGGTVTIHGGAGRSTVGGLFVQGICGEQMIRGGGQVMISEQNDGWTPNKHGGFDMPRSESANWNCRGRYDRTMLGPHRQRQTQTAEPSTRTVCTARGG